jgi:hypothetical protein
MALVEVSKQTRSARVEAVADARVEGSSAARAVAIFATKPFLPADVPSVLTSVVSPNWMESVK